MLSFVIECYFCRPSYARLITPGQLLAQYRLAKPQERKACCQKDPEFSADRYILVSGENSGIPLDQRRLPKHIVLSDGSVLLLLRSSSTRIIDTQEHKDVHRQRYADMFLYIPWDNEEDFLGEASRSFEACRAKWDLLGPAAQDLKQQLKELVKTSLLS